MQPGFTLAGSIALVIIGIAGSMIPALQSTLLPQLVAEHRLSLTQLGWVATAESIGGLIAVSAANILLRHERVRLILSLAAGAAVVANIATPQLAGYGILAARFVHGLAGGVLLWLWIGYVTRSANAGKWMAIYMTAQATALMVLSTWFGELLMPRGGAYAGYAALAAIYLGTGALAVIVPGRFRTLEEAGGSAMPGAVGALGLVAVFAQIAAILALWVYIKPYGRQIGLDEATTGWAVSLAMGSQIVAGLFAIAVAGRIQAAKVVSVLVAGSLAAIGALAFARTPMAFIVATTTFAFLWKMAPSFYIPYLIDIDPSRRAAIHMMPVASLGASTGPALAALSLRGGDVMPVLAVSAGLYALGGGIVAATGLRRRAVSIPA